jgi:hypothetical protein
VADNTIAELREQLTTIEESVDRGDYHPGPWQRLIDELRGRSADDRASLAEDVSRVSRKLHLRHHHYTIGVAPGILIEAFAGIIGGALIAAGIAQGSSLLGIVGMGLWAASFEPLLKVAAGTIFGVHYDYVYLYGHVEPRFKMSFGSYIAIAPLRRAILHLTGSLGSPLGAWLAARLFADELPVARCVSLAVFWLTALMNLAEFGKAIAGMRKVGKFRLPDGSPTMAVTELRWWRKTR